MLHYKSNVLAVILMVTSGVAISISSVFIRLLALQGISTLNMGFVRGMIGIVLCIALFPLFENHRYGKHRYKPEPLSIPVKPWIIIVGFIILYGIASQMYFLTLQFMPLPSATAISFLIPIGTTILARFFLQEQLKLRRIISMLISFVGVVLILFPLQFSVWGLLIGMLFVIMSSNGRILIKILSINYNSNRITLWISMGIALTPMIVWPFFQFFQNLSWVQWLYMFLFSFTAVLSMLLLNQSFRVAKELGVVMAFDYLRIIYIFILNFFIFKGSVSALGWAGGVLIILSAGYMAYREGKLRKANVLRFPRSLRIY